MHIKLSCVKGNFIKKTLKLLKALIYIDAGAERKGVAAQVYAVPFCRQGRPPLWLMLKGISPKIGLIYYNIDDAAISGGSLRF